MEINGALKDDFLSELEVTKSRLSEFDILCQRNDQLEQQNLKLIQDV
jgi:hypothetical protein